MPIMTNFGDLNGFFRSWPWSCSIKQVLFLNELEEILELLGADQLGQISKTLFFNLSRCLDSDHFQVVERALFLWNNEHLVKSGFLSLSECSECVQFCSFTFFSVNFNILT